MGVPIFRLPSFEFKQVFSPVLEVADTAVLVQLCEQIYIHIGDENHFGIGGRLGLYAIGGKSEVAGGEDHGLGILDIHIMHVGKISHTTCNRDVTLVFYGAGLGAVSHAGVAVLGICEKGDEEYIHALVGQQTAEFRKFCIVANENAYFPAIGVKDL